MRGERGYSLVEMVLVIAIISILLAFATLRFDDFARRHGSESQTRVLYMTLLNAQANAVYQRRGARVKLYTKSFEIYSSLAEGAAPQATHSLSYPITWNNVGNSIDFDNMGIPKPSSQRSICVDSSDATGAVDSVVIGTTRVSVGKRGAGERCDDSHIDKK